MKQILFLSIVLVSISSCVNQRQKGSSIGRADEVYFTPSDIRIKASGKEEQASPTQETMPSKTKNYTGSYSDRLSNFGTTNRFNYNNYQPVLVPSAMYNSYSGWGFGLSYGGYSNPYYSNCGCNYSPYNYWGAGYNNYYNPYMCTNHPFGYGYYGRGYSNNGNYTTNSNYSRRTGTYNPSSTNNSNTRVDGNTNGGSSRNNTNPSGRWYNTTSGSGSTSGSSSNSSSGRGSSGGSSGSTSARRR